MPHLPFLGLKGLRTATGTEDSYRAAATTSHPWLAGTPLMIAVNETAESEPPAPVPTRREMQVQAAPMHAAPFVFQSLMTPMEAIHPMQSKGAGLFALPQSKAVYGRSETPAVSSYIAAPARALSQPQSAHPQRQRFPTPKPVYHVEAKPNPKLPGLEFRPDWTATILNRSFNDELSVQSAQSPKINKDIGGLPFKAGRVSTPGQAEIVSTAYIPPRPDAYVGLPDKSPISLDNPFSHSGQSRRFKSILPQNSLDLVQPSKPPPAACAQPPAADRFAGIDTLAEGLTGRQPCPSVRPSRERLQVVTEVIETVVDSKLSKKLAAIQSPAKPAAPAHPTASVQKATPSNTLNTDAKRLARQMMRTMNGLTRADRFRSGLIR